MSATLLLCWAPCRVHADDPAVEELRARAAAQAEIRNAAEDAAAAAAAHVIDDAESIDSDSFEQLRVYRETYWNSLRDIRLQVLNEGLDDDVVHLVNPEELVGPRWTDEMLDPRDPLLTDARFLESFAQSLAQPERREWDDVADFEGKFEDAVYIVGRGSTGEFCSGVLLAPNVVLTAGHCARDFFPTEVRVGLIQARSEQTSKVVLIARHPQYSETVPRHDLMVLIIDPPIDDVETKPLAPLDDILPGAHAVLAGYGGHGTAAAGHTLNGVRAASGDLVVVSSDCDGANQAGRPDRRSYGCTPDHELVAADRFGAAPGADACNGDSGGPLYIEVDGEWRLAAIVARSAWVDGRPRFECGSGTVFVRLDPFWEWIRGVPGGQWPDPN